MLRRIAAGLGFSAILVTGACSDSGDGRLDRTLSAIDRMPGLAGPPSGAWVPAGRGALDIVLPATARAPLRLSLRSDPGFWLEVRATDAREVEARTVRGVHVMVGADVSLDVVHRVRAGAVEELRVLHAPAAATTARYALSVGPAVRGLTLREGCVELRDAQGYLRIASEAMYAIDAHGTRREVEARLEGSTLVSTLDPTALAYPIVVDPVWAATGSMKTGRMSHAAVALTDGRVLVSGGQLVGNEPIDSAEVFDPTKDTWSEAPAMSTKRTKHAAVRLPSGKVLVVGGLSTTSTFSKLASAELYDPLSNSWAAAPSAKSAREAPYAALLGNGKVLLVGGGATTELYDPATNAWADGPSLPMLTEGGGFGGLFLLDSGKAAFVEFHRVHLYDPGSNTWSDPPNFPLDRANQSVASLPGARLMVLGGFGALPAGGFGAMPTSDIFTAATGAWAAGPSMAKGRIYGTLTPRTASELVMVGGLPDVTTPAMVEAEVFDATKGTWSAGGSLSRGRVFHSTTVLPGGQLLVAGGAGDATASPTSTAERFVASTSDKASCKDAVTSVGKDGVEHSCLPFKCGADGACLIECTSSADCAAGNACDVAAKTCAPSAATPSTDGGGGCSTGRAGGPGAGWWIVGALGALLGLRRRAAALGAVALASCGADRESEPSIRQLDPSGVTLTPTAHGFRVEARAAAPRRWVSAGVGALDLVLPAHGAAPLRLSLRGHLQVWVEIEPLGLSARPAGASGGTVVVRDAATALDVFHVTNGAQVEELRVLRDSRAPTTARYRVHAGPGVGSVTLIDGRVEVRDRDGYLRMTSAPMFALDASRVRRTLDVTLQGEELTATLDVRGLTFPVTVDPTWAPAGGLKEARSLHGAVKLPDGRVLVVGGSKAGNAPLASAEIYDPATDTWSAAGAMKTARRSFALELLASGKVLVAGGHDGPLDVSSTSSAELFDPATKTWSAAPSMASARGIAYSATLPGGKVLVAGGGTTAEVYDPTSNTWSAAGTLSSAENSTGGLLVADGGKVVLLSGEHVRIYDPATGKWSDGPNTVSRRSSYTPVTLADGRVMAVAGGITLSGSFRLPMSGDTYSAASNTWMGTTSEGVKGRWLPSVNLRDGKQLIVIGGSIDVGDALPTAEVLDLASNVWSSGGSMTTKRAGHSATLLDSGKILVAGGADTDRDTGTRHASAELYIPDGSATDACKDATTSVGKDGVPKPCAPYRCGADGTCATTCVATSDCAPGAVCDTATKTCAAPTAGADSGGGCGVQSGGEGLGAFGAILSLLGLAKVRRRAFTAPRRDG